MKDRGLSPPIKSAVPEKVMMNSSPLISLDATERELSASCQLLVAKAATISLSTFGLSGNFRFDNLFEKWKTAALFLHAMACT